MTVFAHSQTTNKLVNEAANDSARVSGQDRKVPPALGTNQIAAFGGFRPLASLEKNKNGSGPIKKVGTDHIFMPCKPSLSCFHEMDSDSLFLVLGPKKKRVRTIPYHLLNRELKHQTFQGRRRRQ